MLFYLLASHFVCDYALQTGWMSENKSPENCREWYWPMIAHCFTHGAGVSLVTGSVALGLAETVCHFFIDLAKCKGLTTINADQGLHVLCKLMWFLFV